MFKVIQNLLHAFRPCQGTKKQKQKLYIVMFECLFCYVYVVMFVLSVIIRPENILNYRVFIFTLSISLHTLSCLKAGMVYVGLFISLLRLSLNNDILINISKVFQ